MIQIFIPSFNEVIELFLIPLFYFSIFANKVYVIIKFKATFIRKIYIMLYNIWIYRHMEI